MLASGPVERIGSADGRLRQRRRKVDGTLEEQSFTKQLEDHSAAFGFMGQ
jgi:acetate kinase